MISLAVSPACLWLWEDRNGWELNQPRLSCDQGIGLEGRGSSLSLLHTESSYKLIHSKNNNPCPHLQQHALPALAINQQIPSALSEVEGEGGGFVDLMLWLWCCVIDRYAWIQIQISHPTPPLGLDNKHVCFKEREKTCQDDKASEMLFIWFNTQFKLHKINPIHVWTKDYVWSNKILDLCFFWLNKREKHLNSFDYNLWQHNKERKKATTFTSLPAFFCPVREQIKAEQLSALSFVFARSEYGALKTAALKQIAAHSQLTVSCGFSFTSAKY